MSIIYTVKSSSQFWFNVCYVLMCKRWNISLDFMLYSSHIQFHYIHDCLLTISEALLSPGTSLVTSTVASTLLGNLTGHPCNTFPVSPSRTHTYLLQECSF